MSVSVLVCMSALLFRFSLHLFSLLSPELPAAFKVLIHGVWCRKSSCLHWEAEKTAQGLLKHMQIWSRTIIIFPTICIMSLLSDAIPAHVPRLWELPEKANSASPLHTQSAFSTSSCFLSVFYLSFYCSIWSGKQQWQQQEPNHHVYATMQDYKENIKLYGKCNNINSRIIKHGKGSKSILLQE